MPTLTLDEAFNKLYTEFEKQSAYSYKTITHDSPITSEVRCMYRGPDSKKCAIGIIIPDEAYDERWDRGQGTPGITVLGELERRNVLSLDEDARMFLYRAQELHDSCASESILFKDFLLRLKLTYNSIKDPYRDVD
jgi:hypothetical protein